MGEEEQCCFTSSVRLFFIEPFEAHCFSFAKGWAHWFCLPCGSQPPASSKTTWFLGMCGSFTMLILQHWEYCYALWNVGSHSGDLGQLSEESYGVSFQIVFCFCNKKVARGCDGKACWSAAKGHRQFLVENERKLAKWHCWEAGKRLLCWGSLICFKVGLALHIIPQNRKCPVVCISLLTGYFTSGEVKQCKALPSALPILHYPLPKR